MKFMVFVRVIMVFKIRTRTVNATLAGSNHKFDYNSSKVKLKNVKPDN